MLFDRTPSPLASCFQLFQTALNQLQISYTSEQLEAWMLGIHAAMTVRTRSFHQLDHVLNVGRGLQPTQVLAALYHDVVYHQVDQGFTPAVEQKIKDALLIRDNQLYATAEPADTKIQLVFEVFDFVPGQELKTLKGLNEFLSAVVAIHDLGPFLSDRQVAAVAVCIRATIPFQGSDTLGNTFPMRIASTLERISTQEKWNCTTDMIDNMVRQAVEVANADVVNFKGDDLVVFLDNTWKLLPEANPSLYSRGNYTITLYRSVLQDVEGFMNQLDPKLVFHEFQGFPKARILADMTQHAENNIKQTVEYLRVKLVTIAILEAIAVLTGGDAPIILLAGASGEEAPFRMQIQDFLDEPDSYRMDDFNGVNEIVYHVLNVGRISSTNFDTKSSPLAAFIYAALGTSAIEKHFNAALKAFNNELSWMDFLKSFPGPLVGEIVKAVAKISVVREGRCLELAKRL